MATVTAICTGLALLVLALLAITAGIRNSEKREKRANGGPASIFVAALAYVVVLAPVVIPYGLVLATALLLIVVIALPAIASGLAVKTRSRLGDKAGVVYDWAGIVVSFALLAGILATAGSVLSLMGGVNRWLVTAVIGLAGAGYLLAQGREAASRTSRWTVAIAFIIPAILLLGGAVVSKPAVLVDSLVPYEALPLGTAAALVLAVGACGFLDPAMGLTLRGSQKPGKAALWGAVIAAGFVLVFGLGLILIYGGAFVAPSLQAFLLAAAPALAIGYFMFFAVFVLASAADTQIAAASELAAEDTSYRRRRPVTAIIVVLAIFLAMFVPAPGQIFAVAATIAAAAFGAILPAASGKMPDLAPLPGVVVGIVGAAIVALIMGITSALTFGTATVVCLLVAFVLALVTSLVVGKRQPAAKPAAA
jgi:hypothetical protein